MKDLKARHCCLYCGALSEDITQDIAQETGSLLGMSVMVTFYKCQKCEKYNAVQVDDTDTIADRDKLFKLLIRRAGRPKKESDWALRDKLENRLKEKRGRLMKKAEENGIQMKDGKTIEKI